jgi:dihydrofolate synthase/folylpolyglutamate synthase
MASDITHLYRMRSDFMPLAPGEGRGYNALQMDIDKAYQETLDYLYSHIDYSLQKTFRYSPEKFDLGRMRAFMAALGDPQREYAIIHVAGTKGKGSVSALCASALQAGGYRVGLYTSPHLQDYAERIQVDGQPIPHSELVLLVEELKPYVAASPDITTFEITTALALLYFARREVGAAVVEVGLGGRLDATNICDPLVTVITSISYDHTYLLGETLAEIAGEKAGIIKHGIPVVVSPQMEEARTVLERIAAEREAPVTQVGRDYLFESLAKSVTNQRLIVWKNSSPPDFTTGKTPGSEREEPLNLTIPLLGDHQVENAATAYAALQVAAEKGLLVSESSIRQGFENVNWPARFEIMRHNPPMIIDSAHNRDSALKLRRTLEDYYPDHPVVMVFGASEDKDIQGMLTELLPVVRQMVVTKSTHPRAIEPEKLMEIAQQFDRPVAAAPSVEEALVEAEKQAAGEAIILVTGSIFVAAAARAVWQEYSNEKDLSFTGN